MAQIYIQSEMEKQTTEKVKEPTFNYDLDRMKAHVESGTIKMPSNLKSAEEIEEWLLNL